MEKHRRLRILFVALIFAGALYRYWPMESPLGPCGLGYESLELGCSLAHNATFSDPFAVLKTGPSAHLAPLFPALISMLIKWFGDGPASTNALEWMGALVFAFQLALWPWAAERLGMGFASGIVGAVAWLAVGFILLPMWEAAYVAFLILILAVCMRRILNEQVSTAFVFFTGALAGITLLFNPVPLLPYLALAVWIACFRRIPRVQKLALFLVPFLVISPWFVRNYQAFHHLVLIRDNLGVELWSSNNPCATFSFKNNRTAGCYNHPNESSAEANKVRAIGEYEYNQEKLQDALGWIKNNPGKFANLTNQRFLAFWFYTPGGDYFAGRNIPASILIIWAIVPLSIGGLWLLSKSDRNSAALCFVWLVLFPPIYYFVEFVPRYRYPILWASIMPASFFLSEAAQRIWQRVRKSLAAPSLVASVTRDP
jgi:hypothetical protein